MYYLSPALLPGHPLQPPFDPRPIALARKKLLVDLELSGSDTLNINGRLFTKNEIIEYFEELRQPAIAAYHAAIGEDATLLKFLEKGVIAEDARFKDQDIYNDPAFINWLSPCFYTTLTEFIKACFENTDASGMQAILANKPLMTPHDKQQAWLYIAGILEKNIALFDHYRTRGQKNSPRMMPITHISAFIGHGYLQVIKQLPDRQFGRLKDKYAFNMLHPAIATFNRDRRNRSLSIIWVEDALDLAVSADLKPVIRAKLNELNTLLKKGKKRSRTIQLAFVVAFIMILSNIVNSAIDDNNQTATPAYPSHPAMLSTQPDTTIDTSDSVIIRAHRRGIN